MDGFKKEILERIKKLMNQTILDTKEIEWFRYIMKNIQEIDIPGCLGSFFLVYFNDEDCPMDRINFRKFLEDYRRDNE